MKQILRGMVAMSTVAPRAGAWIETGKSTAFNALYLVAPRAGAWIETIIDWLKTPEDARRPPRGGVD